MVLFDSSNEFASLQDYTYKTERKALLQMEQSKSIYFGTTGGGKVFGTWKN